MLESEILPMRGLESRELILLYRTLAERGGGLLGHGWSTFLSIEMRPDKLNDLSKDTRWLMAQLGLEPGELS